MSMVSARMLAANRANAQASTGPRTAAGKARASRNAVRHGLTSRSWASPETGRAIAEIGRLLRGRGLALNAAKTTIALPGAEVSFLGCARPGPEARARPGGQPHGRAGSGMHRGRQ